MLERVAQNFQCPIIVSNANTGLGIDVLEPPEHRRGPMDALRRGLAFLRKSKVFVTGCDFPFLRRRLVELLCEKEYDVTAPVIDGTIQPLLACYKSDYLAHALNNAKSMADIIYGTESVYLMGGKEVHMGDPTLRSLLNINQVQDLWGRPSSTTSPLPFRPWARAFHSLHYY